jgi:serine phosphatase RsbU (regulator of sigma subunit)
MGSQTNKRDVDGDPAFTKAAVRSELARVVLMLGVFGALWATVALRGMLAPLGGGVPAVLMHTFMGCCVGFEAVVLGLTWRYSRAGRPPEWLALTSLVVDCSLPTLAIVVVIASGAVRADHAVSGPAAMAYLVFLGLSVLRLRPRLCAAAGLLSAGQHLGLVLFALARRGAEEPGMPAPMLLTLPAVVLIGGLASAFVAARMRRQVAAAVEEASRREALEQELIAASQVQRGLLPRSAPDFSGYEIAGWNRPADETGGDYFDWQALPGGRLAVTVADVTGHGLGPALMTAFCRAYSRASLARDESVRGAFGQINTLLSEDLPEGRFVTFVVAVLDAGSADVEVLSAGHGPILHYVAAGETVTNYGAHALPMGIVPHHDFDESTVLRMGAGDFLILLTDGFFEWPGAGGTQFGIPRLVETIRANASSDADGVIRAMVAAVEAHAGGVRQPDDLTAVVIRRTS